jgi:drug/metabolite transporter (DMT)-like permease
MVQPMAASYVQGAACGLAVALISAGWSATTRLAVTTSLDAWDVAALRYGVAGILLSPVLVQRGLARDRLGWPGLAVLIGGAGAPYALLAAGGLDVAPARDQGALNPGLTPLFVALIAAAVLGERISHAQKLGLALIAAGALVIVGWHAMPWSAGGGIARSLGHAMFLSAGLLWACFTACMRHAKLDPLHATALVATGSLALYLPVYFALHGTSLADVPLGELAVQAIFQGVLVTIVNVLLYGRAVGILGAARGAAFLALVPALSALIAIPLLGEWPNAADWAGIALISVGVYVASGGASRSAAALRSPARRNGSR